MINGSEESVDVQLFDIEKCFDALWLEECINDLYDSGLDNDKLPLLFMENSNAKIAVKTSSGLSKRKSIKNIVMQGTVWGSIFCTATMDKLGKLAYANEELLYKYKGEVDTPCLGMVDDILSIQKCSSKALESNAVINAFVESKKLTLSSRKCKRIHISRKKESNDNCPDLKVHGAAMEDSNQEKYLGDTVNSSGKIRVTIEERKSKALAIVSEILAILEDIPLGKYKMEIGLKLRQAMLLNGVLYNSEAWHGVTDSDIKLIETIDEYLLRSLVNGHSKTPIEFLYLEAGAVPIRFLISSRRMIYLQTILKRDDGELIKKIYKAQARNPTPGDFVELLKTDFNKIKESFDESAIEHSNTSSYKKFIKTKVRMAAFIYLNDLKLTHSKVRDIEYDKLETQSYLTSPLFSNEDVNILFSLRSRSVECKSNFKNRYKEEDILCPFCRIGEDSQQHMLVCKEITARIQSKNICSSQIVYEDIFKDHLKQKGATVLFHQILEIRKQLQEADNQLNQLGPCTTSEVQSNSSDLLSCIDDYSSGK